MPRNQTLQLADNVSSSGSEQLHRIALDLVPIGLVYCALDGRFIYVNARMCEITGYAADELLGMTGTQLTHPDDLAHDKKLVHAFLSIGTPDYANEKRYVRKDGSSRWVAVTARMVTDDAGQPLHTVGAVRDIHDRKMAEAALREREAELSRAHRIAGIGSFKVEVRDGNFVADQSPEYLAVHGLTPQDRGNSHEAWLRRLHPEDREKADRTFRECLANGRKLYESEYRIIRQNDSATRWIRVLAEIERDASGAPLRLFGTHLDVTESRLHEAALRTSEIRYRRLFEAAHDGILILDPETRKIVDANPFMTTLIGYPYEQLIGLELFEIGFLADAQESRDMFEKLKATSQVRYENLPLQTKQGGPRDVEVVANLYDEGGHTVVQCNVRDITERKRIERVLRQHEERQAFLLKLSDTIRLLGDPLEIQTAALRVLGEHLAVSRAFYNEIDEERDTYVIHRTYANGVAPLIGHFRLSDIRRTAELAGSGQIVVFDDASADPRLSAAERAAFAAMEMAAGVGVPLIKDGRWVAGLGVHHATPRQWTPEEINLIHETAERTWAAVEQAQAETELQSGAARDVFRVRLTDALRGALTAEEAQETALHALGDHFQASRVMFGEGDEGSTETFTNRHEYCRAPAMPSSVGQHRWDAFGPYVETEFLAGRTLVVDDVQTHPDHSHQELAAYEMVGIKAYLAVPLVRQKRIIAYLAVNHTAMHTWTPDEIALAEETAERIWAAVERARTEAALAKSDNRFRMAISNSPITVFEQDLDLRYTWLYNAKLGFDDTLTLGKTDADLVDPAVAERLNAVKRRALETGQHSRQEVTVERPGHGVNHFDLSVEPRRGPDGQINGIIGTSIDITERKQTETALKASEHRYRTLIEGTSAVSWSCAPSGLQVEPQPQWMAFTGQSAAEMLGTGYARAFHPDDAEDATARWVDAVSRAEPYLSEHRIRRHDGEWRWMRA